MVRAWILAALLGFVSPIFFLFDVWAASPEWRPILQGAVNESSSQFQLLAKRTDGKIGIWIVDPERSERKHPAPERVVRTEQAGSPWVSYQFLATDLGAGKLYRLEIRNEAGDLIDHREFKTFSKELKNRPVRLAMASCMRDREKEKQKAMWAEVVASEPDFLFLLGDNVYVDDVADPNPSIESIWRRYTDVRLALDIFKSPRLIPILATWDDHDFGKNNTDQSFPLKDQSAIVFRAMYAQNAWMPEVQSGPGISTFFSAMGHRFFFMDNRSFRTTKWNPYDQSHWGEAQERWLDGNLSASSDPAWLFNGSQFFGGYRAGSSFEGNHPRRFGEFIRRVRGTSAPLVLGSGDVHYSEVMEIEPEIFGYPTYEITSSSIHSVARKPPSGNPRRIASIGEFNFVVVDAKFEGKALRLDMASVGEGGRVWFRVRGARVGR